MWDSYWDTMWDTHLYTMWDTLQGIQGGTLQDNMWDIYWYTRWNTYWDLVEQTMGHILTCQKLDSEVQIRTHSGTNSEKHCWAHSEAFCGTLRWMLSGTHSEKYCEITKSAKYNGAQ